MGWLSENFDKDLRLRTYVQSICGNQAFLLHYIPPRIRGGGAGADEVQTVENTGDGQTVCPQIRGKWKNRDLRLSRRQLRFRHFFRLSSARLVKLALHTTT